MEDTGVAGHQGRRGEAEDLPQGEVPGHHRQHRAQGLEGHEGASGVGFADLVGEESGAFLGVEFAHPGAFFHFRLGLLVQLAHFLGDEAGQFVTSPAQHLARPRHEFGASLDGGLHPGGRGQGHFLQSRVQRGLVPGRLLEERLAGGGIDGSKGHGAPRHRVGVVARMKRMLAQGT